MKFTCGMKHIYGMKHITKRVADKLRLIVHVISHKCKKLRHVTLPLAIHLIPTVVAERMSFHHFTK